MYMYIQKNQHPELKLKPCWNLQAKTVLMGAEKKRVSNFFVSLLEEIMTHLILSHSVTCQPPHVPSIWQLRACEAADHGCCVRHSGEVEAEGEGGRLNTPCVCACVWECAPACDRMCDRLARARLSGWRDGCMPKARATPCQSASRRCPFQIH